MPSGAPWDAAFFDLDGTVIEPFDGIADAVRCAFAAVDEPPPPDATIRSWIGPPIGHGVGKLLAGRGPDVIATAMKEFRAVYDARGALAATLHPGMRDLIAQLHGAGTYTAVVTMKPRHATAIILEHLGLDGLLDAVHAPGGDDSPADKDSLVAEAVTTARAERGDNPSIVMIGDRPEDVIAARRSAIGALGVAWGFGAAQDLADAGASAVLERPQDLAGMLGVRAARD